jgi:hypothetical protein
VSDLGPPPDALEYAVTARRLAHGESSRLLLLSQELPSRYPFGLPLPCARASAGDGSEDHSAVAENEKHSEEPGWTGVLRLVPSFDARSPIDFAVGAVETDRARLFRDGHHPDRIVAWVCRGLF